MIALTTETSPGVKVRPKASALSAREILANATISHVYRALTGKEPRRTGASTWRGPAVWRDGDGLNVSMDDARNVWHDFVSQDGGGVLDLVVRVRGVSRHDALKWVAELAGYPLKEYSLSGSERVQWARQQRKMEAVLPKARLWRRAALGLGEQVLEQLKVALFDRTLPRPKPGEIACWTTQLTTWHQLEGTALVAEYLWWTQHHPGFTVAMIHVAGLRELAEQRALLSYLEMSGKGKT